MKFVLYFIEYHSDVDFWKKQEGVTLLGIDQDMWGEFEHRIPFEAESVEMARFNLPDQDNSSGVFNVYDEHGNIVLTEEGIENSCKSQ